MAGAGSPVRRMRGVTLHRHPADPPDQAVSLGEGPSIAASRCPACAYIAAPPTRCCPRCAAPMEAHRLIPFGTVLSYTTVFSPHVGFSAPLDLALVEMSGGVKLLCCGRAAHRAGMRVGQAVRIEGTGGGYRFAAVALSQRVRLLWSRWTAARRTLRAMFHLRVRSRH